MGLRVIWGFFVLKIRVVELLSFILQAQLVPLVLCAVWPGKCQATDGGATFLLSLPLPSSRARTLRRLLTKRSAAVVIQRDCALAPPVPTALLQESTWFAVVPALMVPAVAFSFSFLVFFFSFATPAL